MYRGDGYRRHHCPLLAALRSSTASSQTNIQALLDSGLTELGACAPWEKDGKGEAVTFRQPRTRMDEPGRHFSGVKRPSGCRENGARAKTHDLPATIETNHHLIKYTLLTPLDDTNTMCEGLAAAFPTRSGALVVNIQLGAHYRYAVTPPRHHGRRVAGDVRRRRRGGTDEAPRGQQPNRCTPRRMTICCDEFGRAPSCTQPVAGCHPGLRSYLRPTNIFLHGVLRRVRPLLSARRRVPMLPVHLRAAILACRARHPCPSSSTLPSSAPLA